MSSNTLKAWLRDAIPQRHQVPVKYWVNGLAGKVEGEMRLLATLLDGGEVAVDVGGNRGIYAYKLWKLGARVEVFEPNPACTSILKAWAADKTRVAVHAVGLSDCAGSASLLIPVDEAGVEHDASASLEQHAFSQAREVAVPLRTLDSFAFQDVALIKIDVEGHEAKVIRGAGQTIRSSRPALLVEIEQRHIQCPIGEIFEEIQRLGYRGFYLAGGRLAPVAGFLAARDQDPAHLSRKGQPYINNFIFLHQDKMAAGRYRALPFAG